MTIISQLVQFIFYRSQVKDTTYNPTFAAIAIVADSMPMIFLTFVVNEQGINVGDSSINHVPIGLALTYSILFCALFYSFFAAQNKQSRFVQASTVFFGSSVILTLANIVVSAFPGASLFLFIILGLKISCAVRVMTESLSYGIIRAVLALIGISIMSMVIASALFPMDITQAELINN